MAQIGSVGSAVAAALETAGQYMQGQMLEALDGGAVHSLGLLFYMIAAITGLILLTMGGSYKHAFTFLIGPPIFYFLIAPGNRVNSDGVSWQMGLDAGRYDQTAVFRALREVTNEEGVAIQGGADITVSRFFKVWNDIVSKTVQSFVGLVLKLGDENSDRSFVSKTERYIRLYQQDISDPQLKELINREVVQVCGDYFGTLLYLYNPAFSDSIDNITRARLEEKKAKYEGRPTINLAERPQLMEWVRSVGGEEKELYSCREIWSLAVKTLLPEARRAIDAQASSALPTDMVPGETPEDKALALDEVADAYRAKLAAKAAMQSSNQDGSIRVNGADTTDVDVWLVNEVAARLLIRQAMEVNPNISQLQFLPKDDIRREKVGSQSAEVSQGIREISNREEWVGKGDYITAALSMPYVQGLALYFLAMMFPFFAMAIVVPGRHNAFLQWMTLWVWVKSWDVGFAVVMVIDEILYALMPHGPPITNARIEDPGELLKAIFEVDPTYSVNTYYTILATLMLAVPILTAGLVKKGAGELTGALTQGVQQFAGKTGNAAALFQGSLQAQSRLVESNRMQYDAGANPQALARALADPEVVAGMLMSSVGAPALKSMMKDAGVAPGDVQTILGRFAGKTGDQAKDIALAKVKYLLAKDRRHAGTGHRNRRLAQRAVRNGYYNHHNIYGIGVDEYLDLIVARNTYQASGAVAGALNTMIGKGRHISWGNLFAGLPAGGAGGAIDIAAIGAAISDKLTGSDRQLGAEPQMGRLSEAVTQFEQRGTPPVDPVSLWRQGEERPEGGGGETGTRWRDADDRAADARGTGAPSDLSDVVRSGGGVFPGSVSTDDPSSSMVQRNAGGSEGSVGPGRDGTESDDVVSTSGSASEINPWVSTNTQGIPEVTEDQSARGGARTPRRAGSGYARAASEFDFDSASDFEPTSVAAQEEVEDEEIEEELVRIPAAERKARRRVAGAFIPNSEGEG